MAVEEGWVTLTSSCLWSTSHQRASEWPIAARGVGDNRRAKTAGQLIGRRIASRAEKFLRGRKFGTLLAYQEKLRPRPRYHHISRPPPPTRLDHTRDPNICTRQLREINRSEKWRKRRIREIVLRSTSCLRDPGATTANATLTT